MKKSIHIIILLSITFLFNSCKDGGINIFSLQDDIDLGAKVAQEIANDPTTYPILNESTNPQAYQYIRTLRDRVLASQHVAHKNDFLWEIRIIKDDNTLNAFCTPGGYIYVYTGLIKYLDSEDQLAGVIGHEIAHADRRHSTDAMTQQYGIQLLLDIVVGKNQGALTEIASNLLQLKYSRGNESEADEFSVKYLSGTTYQCNGAAGFFEKIEASGSGGSTPAFLSTHPNPENRITDINATAAELGCSTTPSGYNYSDFKNSLP